MIQSEVTIGIGWYYPRIPHGMSYKSRGLGEVLEKPMPPEMVAHTFNFSTWEAEAGESQPASFTEQVPGKPGLHRETLCQNKNNKHNKTNKTPMPPLQSCKLGHRTQPKDPLPLENIIYIGR